MTCQICGGVTHVALVKERNVSCGDYFEGRRIYSADRGDMELIECSACGFASFEEMSLWSPDVFQREIYNQDYDLCDPPFLDERPRKLAKWLGASLAPTDLIDFGGGNGKMAGLLAEQGFESVSFDPFYGDPVAPAHTASIVTAFEVVEHVPVQQDLFATLRDLAHADGLIVFSTLLKPQRLTGDWWYVSPRNGHVSFHTRQSLSHLLGALGLSHICLSDEIHVAARDAARLEPARGWPQVAVNGVPGFVFGSNWHHLTPAP